MKTQVWPIVSAILLISTPSFAGDPGYNDFSDNTRQFNINPGNMADGMFNPMRNFFGGSDRYSNDYYDYRYAPPPAYPPGYGYPGSAYPYAPVYPGYQAPPQAGGYAPPAQQPPAPTLHKQPPAPVSTYRPAPVKQPVFGEKYRFRPLESSDPSTGNEITEPPHQEPPVPSEYSATGQASQYNTVPPGSPAPQHSYRPALEPGLETQQQQMIFRPLDKPGYSQ